MRELLEQGFDVTVAKDAEAPGIPNYVTVTRRLVYFGYMANAVLSTDDAVKSYHGLRADFGSVALTLL